jgi:hypothetical protein
LHADPRLSAVLDLPGPQRLLVYLFPVYLLDHELSSPGLLLLPGDLQKAANNGFVPDTAVPLLRMQLAVILSMRKNSLSRLEMT